MQEVMENAYVYHTVVAFERLVEELGADTVVAALAPSVRLKLLVALEDA